MNNIEIREQTDKYYLPVFGRYPLALTHGKGCMVYDADGEGYLDFLAGIAVNSLGYAIRRLLRQSANRQVKLCTAPTYFIRMCRRVQLNLSAKQPVLTVCF